MIETDFLIILDRFKQQLNQAIDSFDFEHSDKNIKIIAPLEIQSAFLGFNTPYLKIDHSGLGNRTEVIKEIGVLILENNQTYLMIYNQNLLLPNIKDQNFYSRYMLLNNWSDFWRELSDKYQTFYQQLHHLILESNEPISELAKKIAFLSQDKELNLIFFKPFLKILEEKGFELSFESTHELNQMLFPVATDSGLRFVNYDEAKLQSYRNNIADMFQSFHHSYEVQEWFKKKIKTADNDLILKLDNNQHLILHINDFLKSEDFPIIKRFLTKISLENMLERSQSWLKAISKRTYQEKEDDISFVFKTHIYRFVRLLTPNALDREGALLSHCLGRGGYDNFLIDNSREFYSMRNNSNESVVTIEYDPKRRFIMQVQSYRNTCPLPDMAWHLQEFFKFLFPDQKVGFYNSTIANIIGYDQVQIHSTALGQAHPGFFIYTKKQEKEYKHFPLLNPLGQDYDSYNRYLNANTNERLKQLVQMHLKDQLFNKKYYPIEIIQLKNNILKEYYQARKILIKNNIDFSIKSFFNKNDSNLFLMGSLTLIKEFIENRSVQMANREKILLKNKDNWDEPALKDDRAYLNMILSVSQLINSQINISIPRQFNPIKTAHIEGYLANNNFIQQFYVDLPKKVQKNQDVITIKEEN